MKSVLVVLAALCLGLAAGIVWGYSSSGSSEFRLPVDEDWSRFVLHQLNPEVKKSDFDAVLTVDGVPSVKSGEKAHNIPAVRVYCDAVMPVSGNVSEASYLAAEVGSGYAKLFAVESGVYRKLATCGVGVIKKMPQKIRLKRRSETLELVCDGRLVLKARHSGFSGGRAGYDATGGVKVAGLFVQDIGVISFSDDFMRSSAEKGAWKSHGFAKWVVRSIDNPARSANAFIYQGVNDNDKDGVGGISLIGRSYWDSYRAVVSAMGPDRSEVGLVLAASDCKAGEIPDNFCLIKWQSNDFYDNMSVGSGETKPKPGMEIYLFRDKKKELVVAREGGFRPYQWYRLGATLRDGKVVVTIDGHEVVCAKNDLWSGGRVGLYTKSELPAEFDDFSVASVNDSGGMVERLADFNLVGGEWSKAKDGIACNLLSGEKAFAVTGRNDWMNIDISVDVTDHVSCEVGVVAAYRDPENYLACMLDRGSMKQRLVLVRGGKEEILAESHEWSSPVENGCGSMTMCVDRGVVRAGNMEALVADLQPGRAGVIVIGDNAGQSKAVFADLKVSSVERTRPVASINRIFDNERLMAVWSGTAGNWERKDSTGSGFDRVYWHRADFNGDAEIEMDLPDKRGEKWAVKLGLAKGEGNRGYNFAINFDEKYFLSIERDNNNVVLKELTATHDLHRLRFRRAGNMVLGYIDDKLELHFLDRDFLAGDRVAWAIKGITPEAGAVRVYSRNVQDYSFNKAAVDWRVAGGVWHVTNRWECDPRWSFMAGMPPRLASSRAEAYDKKTTDAGRWTAESLRDKLRRLPNSESKLAAIWHKGEFDGDVTVECFVGQMMDNSRGGGRYQNYVQNFCLTLSGDGQDLNKGYTLVFGGWGNTLSAIMRDGKVVAYPTDKKIRQTDFLIPTDTYIHRVWFHLRGEKKGDTVRFFVDMQERGGSDDNRRLLSLEFKDKNPLSGKRVALWTYSNGMLVSRCRISAPGGRRMENPFGVYTEESPCPDMSVNNKPVVK